jgi:hypothetical protein
MTGRNSLVPFLSHLLTIMVYEPLWKLVARLLPLSALLASQLNITLIPFDTCWRMSLRLRLRGR